MGSAGEMGELGGRCRAGLGVEWRAEMLGVWMDLGTEIKGILLGVRRSGVDEKEEEEGC